ncbi:MAG: sugar-binding protein [Oscillospiraceae bacterium]
MKKNIISLFVAGALFLTMVSSFAVMAEGNVKTSEISKGTPVMDGVKDPIWDTTSLLRVEKVPEILGDKYDPDHNFNPRNAKATFKVLWDEKNLYVYADIMDPKTKDADDRFDIFVSPTNHRTKYTGKILGEYDPNAPVAYANSDIYLSFERNKIFATGPDASKPYWPMGCYAEIKSGIVQKKKENGAKGWVLEAAIPWSKSFTPKEGATIGFDCDIDDQDSVANGRGIVVWNQPNQEVWQDPSQAGQLVLKNKAVIKDEDPIGGGTGDGTGGGTGGTGGGTGGTGGTGGGTGGTGGTGGGTGGTASGGTGDVNDSSTASDNSTADSSIAQDSKNDTSSENEGAIADPQKQSNTSKIIIIVVLAVVVFGGAGTAIFFVLKKKPQENEGN